PTLARIVRDGRERRGVEPERVLVVQPELELVDLGTERRGGIVAVDGARVAAAPAVLAQVDDRQPGRLGAARRQDPALVPLEAPERRLHPVLAGIERGELLEAGLERLVLVAEDPDRGAAVEC